MKQLFLFAIVFLISCHAFGKEQFVGSVSFQGNTLFSDFVLQRNISLREDVLFTKEALSLDIAAIQKLYEEEGYFQIKIEPRVTKKPKSREIDIVFHIREGHPTIISEFSIDSIGKPKSKRIRRLFSTRSADIYLPKILRDDLRGLKTYFVDNRYLSARLFPEKIIFNKPKNKVKIEVRIKPGPKYIFKFNGLYEFSSSQVLDPLLSDVETALNISAQTILNHLIYLYQSNGFYHVETSYDEELDEKRSKKIISFLIQENTPVKISHFLIQGNKHFSQEYYLDLIEKIAPPVIVKKYFSQEALDSLPSLILDHLKNQGFLFSKVHIQNLHWDNQREYISPEFLIQEGPRTLIDNVNIYGNQTFSKDSLVSILDLPKEKFLPMGQLGSRLSRIIEHYQENGFLNCKIENMKPEDLISYSTDSKTSSLNIKILEGPQIKIGNIIFRGLARTRNRVLERELTFKKGDIWNLKEIQRSENNLFRLGLFSGVKILPKKHLFKPGENDMIIEVTERLPGLTEFGGGFKSDEGFHAFSGIAYRNAGGWHRVFSLRGDVNRKTQGYHFLERKIEFGFSDPYLASIPFIIRFNVIHKKNSALPFDILSWEGKLSFDKHLWNFLRATFQYDFQYRDIFRAVDIRDLQDKIIASIGPSFFFDFRDNSFNPKKGFSTSISSLFFLPAIGSDPAVSLTRNLLTTTFYVSPWSWLTLALLGQTGYAHSFSDENPIPVDQRFYLGGRSSIRGFEEDIIGSNTKNRQIFETSFINYKSEIRLSLFSDVGVAFFLDGGNVFFDSPTSGSKFRHSFGPGLRYHTPIGPLSLDYGFIAKRIEEANEPVGRLHFSIGLF